MKDPITYKNSGVDIDAGTEVLRRIKKLAKSTHIGGSLAGIGSFGSLFNFSSLLEKYKEPVLVQSVDGVGTKLMVARMANKYDTVGHDIVNHCLNDILCQGAKGLTFLDYVATDKLHPNQIEKLVEGLAKACLKAGVELVGGETAELPGIYAKNEFDLVGMVTGVVEKSKIIDGSTICAGDAVLGMASAGLHTNGYTMARKIFFDKLGYSIDSHLGELGHTVGEEFLIPHKDYSTILWPLIQSHPIKGLAHITGGGLLDNVPRILGDHLDAVISKSAWEIPPIFRILSQASGADEDEMMRTFNMGIGMVIVIAPQKADSLAKELKDVGETVFELGLIEDGRGITRMV
ncbi:MAG TPA: phosphoribosylformylglycinamidine cyclo-ligase [Nitrospinota bacterium]|jgi:phosphoribosylformylglycinamidine cyclo-ligase|nr:phosphoribosylformylglycinamidine cyclo-ligase [Nitrospinota bacterium]|tara:strand:- start:62005 stop:63045 length:1041 start_codon:yes stop_codon:yes gene_type:complete